MNHPYKDKPASAFWSSGVAKPMPRDVDPVLNAKFQIDKKSRIATAGSCFAQNISRVLIANGYNYRFFEPSPPMIHADVLEQFGYGVYSARYGNIYSSKQLLQLFDRAYGTFKPEEGIWCDGTRFFDPFRPGICPGGYYCKEELEADREQHFAAVRGMFEDVDVFGIGT